MQKEIEKIIKKSVEDIPQKGDFGAFGEVTISKNPDHGDYSSSIPLKIAKLKGSNPMEEARIIVNKIAERDDWRIKKVEAAEPGFVNFFLSKEFLKAELLSIIDKGDRYGSNNQGKGKTVIVDYSSPNIAKLFGVGHLRSTIIGQSIFNIYNFLGWRCIGDNHLGDWGTQFGKLICQIKRSGHEDDVENLTIGELEDLYISFHKDAEEDPDLEDGGRMWFKKLESGDKEAMKIWKSCVDTSITEFSRIYKMLGIKIDMALGESFYAEMTGEVVTEMKEKGLAKESEKALIVEFSDKKLPPIILVKSDGTTTYFARDLAAIKYRIGKWNPDLFIYEVGSDQSLYFKQVFEMVKLLHWGEKSKFVHVAHGLVRWKHGKFSTRRGDTIHLEDILNETIKRASNVIEESGTAAGLSKEEKSEIARMAGIGAVKYNDLSQHYSKDILFDWDKMLNLKGNSGPYIQYTFARASSVLEKSGGFSGGGIDLASLNTEEDSVLRKVRIFPQIVEEAGRNFSPNVVCNFLFDLAQAYNLFYSKHRIIGSDNKEIRIAITAAVAHTLKNGLTLLGIDAPERM